MTDDSKQRKRRVCLFGLSADPPTGSGGHLGIVEHLASMEMFDQIRVLPVYSHMFAVSRIICRYKFEVSIFRVCSAHSSCLKHFILQSKRGKQAPFQSRIQMCQLLFKDIPNVIVSEAERICFEKVSDGL